MEAKYLQILRSWWFAVCPKTDFAELILHKVLDRYSEPHRKYHTTDHVYNVLYDIESDLTYPPLKDEIRSSEALWLAAWYHDVVYDPEAPKGKNELDSAQMAYDDIVAMGMGAGLAGAVSDLILVTINHNPSSPEETSLVDADFGIFKEALPIYKKYAEGIRLEYKHVPDVQYFPARLAFLSSLLERPQIFCSNEMWFYEDQAKENIQWEMMVLTNMMATIPA